MSETACPLDCPDACSLRVDVDGSQVVRIEGDHRNPMTDGLVCGKVRGFARLRDSSQRVLYPALRDGPKGSGRFRRVSWDEALSRIASELTSAREEHGGESILPLSYGGSNGLLTHECVDARLFHRLGASRLDRTVCAAPTGRAVEGLYGRMPGVALPDYEHADVIVLWGVNPNASGIHHVPVLKRAQQRGARIAVVDPRRTPLARTAELHLPIRPGTDLPLALAVIDWLARHDAVDRSFLQTHCTGGDELLSRARAWPVERAAEECDVPPESIEALARLWAEGSPAVVRCGWGLERNRNGGSAAAAVLALPAVAGKLGVRGGGYTTSNSRAIRPDATAAINAPEPDTRLVNMNRIGRVLTDDRSVRVLLTYCCNPVATLPHQTLVRRGLAREDLFHVVFEQVHNDTTRWADVLLPATTFLEHDDLAVGYGAMVLNRIRPVVPPLGEARPNHEVFAELCDRLGLSRADDPRGAEALIDTLVGGLPDAERVRGQLAETGVATPAVGPCPIPMVDDHPRTDDGKIHLFPAELDAEAPYGLYHYQPDPGTEAHPLALLSPASAKTTNSTFGGLDRRPAAVVLHPDDAAERGIAEGDRVEIESAYGSASCLATLSSDVRRGVAELAKGLWSHRMAGADGNTANALAPDTLTDLGGGATFNDARVQITRAG